MVATQKHLVYQQHVILAAGYALEKYRIIWEFVRNGEPHHQFLEPLAQTKLIDFVNILVWLLGHFRKEGKCEKESIQFIFGN